MPSSTRFISFRLPDPRALRSDLASALILCACFRSSAQPARIPAEYRTAPRALVTQAIDPTRLAPLSGAIHPQTAGATDLGPVPDTLPLEHIQLLLRRPSERQAAFDSMVQALNHPGSPSFHQWLTPDEIGSAFGPSASDIAAVLNFLTAHGFTINRVSRSGLYLDFNGTAAQVREAFGTEIHSFRLAASGQTHSSAAQPAHIPQALAPVVAGFVSLSDIPFPSMHHIVSNRAVSNGPAPAYRDNNGNQSLGAQDFYTVYNERPLLTAAAPINGSGQTIALLEETDIVPDDVTVFRTTFAVTPAAPALTIAHGSPSVACTDPGITGKDEEGEAVLDTEWAGAVAPSATLLLMACASTNSTQGIILSAEAVIDDNLAPVMSLSYGGTEVGQASFGSFMSQLWEQAAAQGQTVVVSAGDSGSDTASDGKSIATQGLNVNVLSSTAYNISAGGTDFQDSYNQAIDSSTAFGPSAYWSGTEGPGRLTAKSYIAETTWNGSCASSLLSYLNEKSTSPTALCDDPARNTYDLVPDAGSGGASILNARPGWQNATVFGLPSTASYPGRLQPDLSLFASNYIWSHALALYQSDESTSLGAGGGTSFVAPQLAGVFALIAQKTNSRLGLANVQLYNLAGSQFGTTAFLGSGCNGSGASGIGETSTTPAASCVFYDIQTGNISDACAANTPNCFSDTGKYGILSTSTSAPLPAYTTGQGYDMATGIGSLNIANLVNNWSTTTLLGSATTLSLNQTTFDLGTPVSFTVAVAPASGTATPTGSVAVVSSTASVNAADATLSNGTATATARTFPGGTYAVFARYLGDGTFAPSSSTPTTLTVNPHATATALAAPTPSSATYGGTATLTATLSPTSFARGDFVPTGSLVFYDGSTVICPAAAFNSSGVATCVTPPLTVATHTFKAVYPGDRNFSTSTSSTTSITVTAATPTVTVSPATVTYGTAVATLTASVTFTGPAAPTGAVTFTLDGGSSIAATCAASTATLTCTASANLAALNAGSHTVTAAIASDTNYTAASNTGTLTINPATPAITFTVPGHHYGDAPFTVAATSNSAGAITYSVLSGPATVSGTTVTLTGSGTVTLQAAQSAAGNYAVATVATSFSVTSAASVWLGNGNSTLSAFSTSGIPVSSASGYTGGGLGTIPAPLGVAFDHAGNLWIANSSGGISEFDSTGSPVTASPYTGAGINSPRALALDGLSQVWIANANGTVSLLSNAGAAISPATGYTGPGLATPGGIAIDLSGNVWIANTSGNSITEIIGAAAPLAPLSTAVTNGTTGVRP